MNSTAIRLRAMEPEDLDLLYQIENDRSLWHVGASNVPYSRYALHDFIAHTSGDIYADKQVRLMIESEDGATVGMVDLVNFDAKNCRAEIGLVISSQYRRRGYASATLQAIHQYADEQLHLHQLYAFIDVHNEASLRLFSNHGYVKGTILTDWLFDGHSYHDALLMQKML